MRMRLFISKITRQYFIFKTILVVPYKNKLTTQTAGNEYVKDPTNHEHEQQPNKLEITPQPTGNTHALNPKIQPDPCLESLVVYHFQIYSGISKWKINGKRIFGRPNEKIGGINGLLKKVVLFDRLEHFSRFILFHLHFFWVVLLVPGS